MASTRDDVSQTRERLTKRLQLYGFSVCREAMLLLEDHFTSSMAINRYESMDDFISKLHRVILFETHEGSSVIDPDLAFLVVQKLCNQHQKLTKADGTSEGKLKAQVDDNQSAAGVGLDAETIEQQRQVPAGDSLTVRVKNVECLAQRQRSKQQVIGTSAAKHSTSVEDSDFLVHYKFLFKRLTSLPLFKEHFQLTNLATLTGSQQPSIRCICFGLLVKDISKIDSYTLIDNTGRVPVRITPETSFRNRLAYLNCLVLVEGVYVNPDDVLFAANVGLPPVLLDPIREKQFACQEEKMVIILKELYMDDEDICKAVDLLFMGYDSLSEPPLLFILIGDFTRDPCLPNEIRVHFKKLLRSIRACENLKQSHFVFVPGQRDTCRLIDVELCENKSMPKAPLSTEQVPVNFMTTSGFKNVHLATNPAHIYVGDRQISVVGHSYLKELKKNILHDLSDRNEEFFETAKQIILSNAHLAGGTTKSYQNPLNLWHRPDLLVLADTEAFGNKYDYSSSKPDDTSFLTLPSFSRQNNQFKVYYLTSGEIDDSEVSLEALKELENNDEEDAG